MTLSISTLNPRYFQENGGRIIYLGGTQIYNEIQDYAWSTTSVLNWNDHLDWLISKGLNYDRCWIVWHTKGAPGDTPTTPMMYDRSSTPGANDGGNKFDLTSLNQAFFDRLASRIAAAENKGIYLSLMLFDRWAWNGTSTYNVFVSPNNINIIDWDETEFFTTDASVLIKQKAYIDKFLETIQPFNNVIIEVDNEPPNVSASKTWLTEIVSYIHDEQVAHSYKLHPVYVSWWGTVTYQDSIDTGADLIGARDGTEVCADFKNSPSIHNLGLPIILDEDHNFCIRNTYDTLIPWKAFLRGYHYILFDTYPYESEYDPVRLVIGQTVTYANKMGLANMIPQAAGTSVPSSTAYCLYNSGKEYLFYQSGTGIFTITVANKKYSYEWFNPTTGAVAESGVATFSNGTVTPPFVGVAVLYLNSSVNDFSADSNCKALWKFNSGALMTDSKGSNTLTNSGVSEGADWKEGNGSGDWKESQSDYMTITDTNLVSGFPLKSGDTNKVISVCLWFKITSLADGEEDWLYGKYDSGVNKKSFLVGVWNDAGTIVAEMYLGYNNGVSGEWHGHLTGLSVGTWYHGTFSYQNSDKAVAIQIRDTNGNVVGTDYTATATLDANKLSVSDVQLVIGATRNTPAGFFEGLIDEMVVFNDIITPTEATQIAKGIYGAPLSLTGILHFLKTNIRKAIYFRTQVA